MLEQLRGGADFGQLADSVSIDPGTKGKGGDLGWFAFPTSGDLERFLHVLS